MTRLSSSFLYFLPCTPYNLHVRNLTSGSEYKSKVTDLESVCRYGLIFPSTPMHIRSIHWSYFSLVRTACRPVRDGVCTSYQSYTIFHERWKKKIQQSWIFKVNESWKVPIKRNTRLCNLILSLVLSRLIFSHLALFSRHVVFS